MDQAKTAEDLQREVAEKEVAYKAKKKARLEKPDAANDKGSPLPSSPGHLAATALAVCLCGPQPERVLRRC